MIHPRHSQRGAALLVALIILVMVTLMAITASRFTLLGTRSSLNFQLQNTAFQAAEAGIKRGSRQLTDGFATSMLAAQGVPMPSFTAPEVKLTTGAYTSTMSYTIVQREFVNDDGSSLGEDKTLFQKYRYVVSSTATVDGHNIQSRLEQGLIGESM